MNADRHWLNRDRLLFYSRVMLLLFIVFGLRLAFFLKDEVDLNGQPLASDFVTFWAASHLALTGHAPDAYTMPLLFKAEQAGASVAVQKAIPWFYPPSFYLVVLPLALLPYMAAYWLFMVSTLSAYLLVLRRIVRGSTAMWCLAAFSGLWLNFVCGQNAFLTAALAGAALLGVERRPLLAGLFTGLLLALKPHLALLFPVAFIAIGAWRILITAAVTAISFTAVSIAVLGTAVLRGFLENLGHARLFLENGSLSFAKMSTVFAFLRLPGTPVASAYFVHFVIALAAVVAVWRVWRQSQNLNLRSAALMTGTFLVSPYLFDYDLAWLTFPIAWLVLDGLRNGWLRGDREVLVAAWILPLLMPLIATFFYVQVGPFVLCGLLWITVRRVTASSKTCANRDLSGDSMT